LFFCFAVFLFLHIDDILLTTLAYKCDEENKRDRERLKINLFPSFPESVLQRFLTGLLEVAGLHVFVHSD